jgi:organic hydroperoxide reductase OsmC/OhrA
MLTQLTRFASVMNLPIDAAEIDLRARFPLEGKFGLDPTADAAMKVLSYTLAVQTSAAIPDLHHVVELAERFCHAARSLRVPVRVDGSLVVNGESVARLAPDSDRR